MDQGNNASSSPTGPAGVTGGAPAGMSTGYQAPAAHQPHRGTRKGLVLAIGGVLVALAIGFAGGVAYQKGQSADSDERDNAATQSESGARQGRMRTAGTVTAVSATSITITTQRDNESKTYTVNADTKATSKGATAAVADIKAGDIVVVQTSPADETVATQISFNTGAGSAAN